MTHIPNYDIYKCRRSSRLTFLCNFILMRLTSVLLFLNKAEDFKLYLRRLDII